MIRIEINKKKPNDKKIFIHKSWLVTGLARQSKSRECDL